VLFDAQGRLLVATAKQVKQLTVEPEQGRDHQDPSVYRQ
jgi:hypothetical protein